MGGGTRAQETGSPPNPIGQSVLSAGGKIVTWISQRERGLELGTHEDRTAAGKSTPTRPIGPSCAAAI